MYSMIGFTISVHFYSWDYLRTFLVNLVLYHMTEVLYKHFSPIHINLNVYPFFSSSPPSLGPWAMHLPHPYTSFSVSDNFFPAFFFILIFFFFLFCVERFSPLQHDSSWASNQSLRQYGKVFFLDTLCEPTRKRSNDIFGHTRNIEGNCELKSNTLLLLRAVVLFYNLLCLYKNSSAVLFFLWKIIGSVY